MLHISIVLFLFSCSLFSQDSITYNIEKTDELTFKNALKNEIVFKGKKKFSLKKGSFNVPFGNEQIVYTDSLSLENWRRKKYVYLGTVKELDLHIVNVMDYENDYVQVIDSKRRLKLKIFSSPKISSDLKFLASYSKFSELDGLDRPNGINVFSIKDNYNSIFKINTMEWVPWAIAWESNRSLILKVRPIKSYLNSNYYEYYRVKF